MLILVINLVLGVGFAQDLDCRTKGCMIHRESPTLMIYFRGHTSEFGGSPGRLAKKYWVPSAKSVLSKEPYNLQKYELNASIYATGSSHLNLSKDEIETLMADANASEIILASHSGGYAGLRETLNQLDDVTLEKVKMIYLLDNFYSPALTKKAILNAFTRDFLRDNCYGYTTPHNRARYEGNFASFCPKVDELANGFHVSGIACMENYVLAQRCQ